jgi:hypothetical protein
MCLTWMREKGWYDRPGVRILEGRWQDFFPFGSHETQSPNEGLAMLRRNLLLCGQQPNEDYMADIGKFDIVYFDTFEEGYRGHFEFIKNVPGLLRGPGSRFSYFNGHAGKGDTAYQVCRTVPVRSPTDFSLLSINHELAGVHGGCTTPSQRLGYEHRIFSYVTSRIHTLIFSDYDFSDGCRSKDNMVRSLGPREGCP